MPRAARRAASSSTSTPTASSRSARGRPHPAADRPLGRQPDRSRDHLEAGGDGRRRAADRGPRADLGGRPVERRRALPGRADRRPSRSRPRRRSSRPAAPRRSGGAPRTRWGAIGAGPVMAAAAGAELADLEFCQFHPTALALPGTALRRAADHRGGPRRGGDPARRRGAPLHRRARAARRGHRRDPRPDRGRRRRRVAPRPARARPRALPQRLRARCRGRARPEREPVPVAPAAHYTMGGDRGRPRRPLLAARALRGRRVLVHRPARRQPARLQLAQRVLRLRRPRRGGRRDRGVRRGSARRSRDWRFEPPERERPATPSGRSPDRCGARSGCAELLGDPYPLARRDRDRRARARASRAAATCAPTSPISTPASTASTSSLAADGETRRESWR